MGEEAAAALRRLLLALDGVTPSVQEYVADLDAEERGEPPPKWELSRAAILELAEARREGMKLLGLGAYAEPSGDVDPALEATRSTARCRRCKAVGQPMRHALTGGYYCAPCIDEWSELYPNGPHLDTHIAATLPGFKKRGNN